MILLFLKVLYYVRLQTDIIYLKLSIAYMKYNFESHHYNSPKEEGWDTNSHVIRRVGGSPRVMFKAVRVDKTILCSGIASWTPRFVFQEERVSQKIFVF